MERGHIQIPETAKFFGGTPIISGMDKAIRTSNFVRTIIGSIRTKAHEKFWEK